VETLDNGKPIRESRDVDIPLARLISSTTPGGRQTRSRRFRCQSQGVGRRRSDHPWNFPLLMRRGNSLRPWRRQHVRAEAAETTPLSAVVLAEILEQAELPPGVVNVVTVTDRPAPRCRTPRRRQDCLHWFDRSRSNDSTTNGRQSQAPDARTGGKGANIVFDDAPIDEMIEGSSMASFSTRTCVLRRFAPVGPRVGGR